MSSSALVGVSRHGESSGDTVEPRVGFHHKVENGENNDHHHILQASHVGNDGSAGPELVLVGG